MCKYSAFWSYVMGRSIPVESNTERYSLEEVAKEVLSNDNESFPLRINRELVDLRGQFRYFTFQNNPYIIKILSYNKAYKEYSNAVALKNILMNKGLTTIYVPIPKLVNSVHCTGLLMPYYGMSLYENCLETSKKISLEQVGDLFVCLLEAGIEWAGLLPRNMFLNNGMIVFIDFEDFRFANNRIMSIDSLTIFKLVLGWSQIYGCVETVRDCILNKVQGYQIDYKSLDPFEWEFSKLVNIPEVKTIRNLAAAVTYRSEGPLEFTPSLGMLPMDIGHLIDEHFETPISVWYTCCSAHERQKLGESVFSSFIESMQHVLAISLKDKVMQKKGAIIDQSIKCNLMLVMLEFFIAEKCDTLLGIKSISTTEQFYKIIHKKSDICKCIIDFQLLKQKTGLKYTYIRSCCINKFMNGVYGTFFRISPIYERMDLLLRGSCAQYIMNCRSDVDFEISGPEYPNGFYPGEDLIMSILKTFNIESEGSKGRPLERDVVFSNGQARELNEWFELTKPNCQHRNRGWMEKNERNKANNFNMISAYERNPVMDVKFLFYKIRSVINRLANERNITATSLQEKLKELRKYEKPKNVDALEQLLEDIVDMREKNIGGQKNLIIDASRVKKIFLNICAIERTCFDD